MFFLLGYGTRRSQGNGHHWGWVIQTRTQEDEDLSDFLALKNGSKPFQAALKKKKPIFQLSQYVPSCFSLVSVGNSGKLEGKPIMLFFWGKGICPSWLTGSPQPAMHLSPRHLQWIQPQKCLDRSFVWGWHHCQNAAYWSKWRHSCQAKGNQVQLAYSAILLLTRKIKQKTMANCSSAQEYKSWHLCCTSDSYYPCHMVAGLNNWNAGRIFWFPV